MQVNKVIERAEKFRTLSRFDKKSAIDYINDGLYEISKRQSIKLEESFYSFQVNPIRLANQIVKVESIDFGTDELNKQYSARVMQDNEVWIYRKEQNNKFVKISFDNEKVIDKIDFVYTGYRKITGSDQVIPFPPEFETSLVYFLRSKMLEEIAEFEASQYFETKFYQELRMKAAPKVDVVSQPSEYSLR